jgi:hypothetical protein
MAQTNTLFTGCLLFKRHSSALTTLFGLLDASHHVQPHEHTISHLNSNHTTTTPPPCAHSHHIPQKPAKAPCVSWEQQPAMAKATTIKDALKKLEETRGVTAAELEKVWGPRCDAVVT